MTTQANRSPASAPLGSALRRLLLTAAVILAIMSTVVTSLLALALTEVLDWIDIVSLSLGAIVISALAARRLTWRGKLLVIVGAVTVTGIEWYLLLRPLLD